LDLLPGVDEELLNMKIEDLEKATREAVLLVPQDASVLAYSGGIDSSLLASLEESAGGKAKLLTMGVEKSSDVSSVSTTIQSTISADLIVKPVVRDEVERAAKLTFELVHVSTLSHLEDCIAFWLISEYARTLPHVNNLLSANGPDELFCGYDRFRRILDSEGYGAVEKEISRALDIADALSRQVKSVATHFGLGIVEPFLNHKFRSEAIKIPSEYKILPGNDLLRKRIWRCLGRSLNLPEEIVMRPKKAMQYGMGIHGIVSRMLKRGDVKFETTRIC
jgi:asparagine synthase (glutamine-hydrolysing)